MNPFLTETHEIGACAGFAITGQPDAPFWHNFAVLGAFEKR
jgi:hypothetical protein